MTDSDHREETVADEAEQPSMSSGLYIGEDVGSQTSEGLAPNEAFQRLASDVRLAVLVHLLEAERNEEGALSFSELLTTVGSDFPLGPVFGLVVGSWWKNTIWIAQSSKRNGSKN